MQARHSGVRESAVKKHPLLRIAFAAFRTRADLALPASGSVDSVNDNTLENDDSRESELFRYWFPIMSGSFS